MSTIRYGMNRMVAPKMGLSDFLDLTAAVGGSGVELRNDLKGLDVTDGLDTSRVNEMCAERSLSVISINAVQHFNVPSALSEAGRELRRLIRFASALGRPGIVMCPHNDPADSRSQAEMARDTRAALVALRPVVEDAGVIGLVEPLGFPESSLRSAKIAAEILGEVGSDSYRLTLDTFHFALAGLDPGILGTAAVPADLIGLVHLSGVTKDGDVEAFRDPDRVLVDANDRVNNVASLKAMLAAGFGGYASFEPFSPAVHALSRDAMESAFVTSMRFIESRV